MTDVTKKAHSDERRSALQALAAAALLPVAGGVLAQGKWPERPVKIVVPFSAGGTTDVVARALAQNLTEAWGQSVVVENRAGAGGNIGADLVAKSPPDGYTILMTSGSIFTVNPHMYKQLPFDPVKDFIAVTNVASGPQLVVVHPSVPAKSVKELIALAKAKPGTINFGSAGIGSQVHMAGENFVERRRHPGDAHSLQGRERGARRSRGGLDPVHGRQHRRRIAVRRQRPDARARR